MKQIKISLIQGETQLTTTFDLNENQAKDMGIIVGTAINAVNRKITLARQLGARLLQLNKPCDIVMTADGVNIDTRLLDAGIIGAKKEFKLSFMPSATEKRQQAFARRVWAATQLLLQAIPVVHINQITGQKVTTDSAVLMVENAVVEPAAIEEPATISVEIPETMMEMQAAPNTETVRAHTVPGKKKNRQKKVEENKA